MSDIYSQYFSGFWPCDRKAEAAGDEQGEYEQAKSEQELTLPVVAAQVHNLQVGVGSLRTHQDQRFEEMNVRVQGLEAHLQEVENRQARQGDLEALFEETASELESRLTKSLNALAERVEEMETRPAPVAAPIVSAQTRAENGAAPGGMYQQAWQAAPLTLRLKFIADLLPGTHPAQSVLKEAGALEELRRRGHDLESWLNNYPALFADAAQVLETGASVYEEKAPGKVAHDADKLAAHTLLQAREALETTLQTLGVMWIAPLPGDAVTLEHEVIGEEAAAHPTGSVARVRRRGFRAQGRLALPAQVLRAIPLSNAASDSEVPGVPEAADAATVNSEAADRQAEGREAARNEASALAQIVNDADAPTPQGGAANGADMANAPIAASSEPSALPPEAAPDTRFKEGLPPMADWQRLLAQQTFRCDAPAVSRFVEQILALGDLPGQVADAPSEEAARQALSDALLPLLPLLGLRFADGLPDVPETWGQILMDARPPFLAWLEANLDTRLIAPQRGVAFDAQTMEVLETRRTVHADENDTVSRLERVGLTWKGVPLMRAQVVRYAAGGNP